MATLERLRGALEDIEEIDRLVVAELDGSTAKTQREQITSDHKLAAFLRATQERARTCLDIYKDEDGLKKAEVAAMSGPAALSNFYDQLRSTKDYHRRFRDTAAALPPLKDQLERDADAEGRFSGEESMGRYVDLNAFYQRFVNLPGNRRHAKLDYRSYLDLFADFQRQGVPVAQKRAVYTKYVADLGDYLRGFYARCNPLADTDELAARAEEEFAKTLSLEGVQEKPGFLDLSGYSSAQELEALGLERLKAALQALALKCGGSLQERAARLFRAKGRSPAELLASADSAHSSSVLGKKKKKRSRKRKAANGGGGASGGGGDGAAAAGNGDGGGDAALRREVAQREFLVGFYERLLANTVKNTKQYTETRQIRTYEELAAEQVAQEEAEALRAAAADGADGDSDDEEAPTYNPLNLPLGWDGKPIPFWLYKLHGLGEEFKCEICGNESYWGRRAFDRHFQESRHSYGMRCLGIPNTKHFHDITLIEDARALYAKMQGAVSKETWVPDEQEEFEDSEGNVFDKKTYEDLAKQGLL